MATNGAPGPDAAIDPEALADRICMSSPETIEEAAVVARTAVMGTRRVFLVRDRNAIRRALEIWAARAGVSL